MYHTTERNISLFIHWVKYWGFLPAATKLGQGNVFTGVCDSVHGGGAVCHSASWDTPPRSRHPPPRPPGSRHIPWEQTPPGSWLRHTVNERPVRTLLECILVLCISIPFNHSFGYCEKIAIKGHKPVGHYGNGFKSGSMRIGKDALVFTKHATSGTKSVGFLSQTFLAEIKAETVLVPIVTWNLDTGTYLLHIDVLRITKMKIKNRY